jgi:hypothetical protein
MSANASDQSRLWIVRLMARSAVRLQEEDQSVTILAGPLSTAPVVALRLRNLLNYASADLSAGAPTFVRGFAIEAAGHFPSVETAVSALGNLANSYFQIIALAGNAATAQPEDVVAFAPPTSPDGRGEYVVQRHSLPRSPAAKVRKLPVAALMELLEAFNQHPAEEQLHRALAHYRSALSYLDPQNRVLAAEALWMAVENLSHVILNRLRAEHGLKQNGEGKHQLAVKLGFPPANQGDRQHLGVLDGHIRRELIFGGDRECYRRLKDLSDGFEHGFMSFDEIQLHSQVTDAAFANIRDALLREIGVPDGSVLFEELLRRPLGDWDPALELRGHYRDSAAGVLPGLTPETAAGDWPNFSGLGLIPYLSRVEDRPDGIRDIELKIRGDLDLDETQSVGFDSTLWVLPGADGDAPPARREVTLEINGEVIERIVHNGDELADSGDPSPDADSN